MDAEEKYETLTAPVDSTSSPGVVSTEKIAIIRRHYLEHSGDAASYTLRAMLPVDAGY
jgi:hypothetical protein